LLYTFSKNIYFFCEFWAFFRVREALAAPEGGEGEICLENPGKRGDTVGTEAKQMEDKIHVPVDDRDFVGIGKMFFNTPDASWNIPHLHFLVDSQQPGYYEAICLEFALVASGKTPEESIEGLATLTHSHIMAVMENGDRYDQFLALVDNYAMEDYWRTYRVIEFSLARQGKDLSHNIDKQIERAVRSLISAKRDKALDELARAQAAGLITEVKRIVSLAEVFDFEYTPLRGAA
jgi:hypothetical protein